MKIGMDLKTKKKKLMKKRILSVEKQDTSYLFYRCWESSLVSGRSRINDNKAAQRQLEELKYHNYVMESHGVYLAPYKRGRRVTTEKIKKRLKKNVKQSKMSKMLKDVTTKVQL